MNQTCHECGKDDRDTRVRKCPICFKFFCEEHAYQRSGLWFCSNGCAEYFFHVDPDD